MIEHLLGQMSAFPETLRVDVTLQPRGGVGVVWKAQPIIAVDAVGIIVGEYGGDVRALPWSAVRVVSVAEC